MTIEEALTSIVGALDPAEHDEALSFIRDHIAEQDRQISNLMSVRDKLQSDYDAVKDSYTKRFRETYLDGFGKGREERKEEPEEIRLKDLDIFSGATE